MIILNLIKQAVSQSAILDLKGGISMSRSIIFKILRHFSVD